MSIANTGRDILEFIEGIDPFYLFWFYFARACPWLSVFLCDPLAFEFDKKESATLEDDAVIRESLVQPLFYFLLIHIHADLPRNTYLIRDV